MSKIGRGHLTPEVFISRNREYYETLLKQFIEMPTVSPDPERKDDIRKCAVAACGLLFEAGFSTRIVDTQGHPIVFGERIVNPGFKTALIYGHLDVQPADASEWISPPFKYWSECDKYYGRGAVDDKGPTLAAFLAAKYTIENKPYPVNFQLVWEFEEETGSPNFGTLFDASPMSVEPDVVLVVDGNWAGRDKPAIDYGLRGAIAFTLVLETGEREVHSGTAGGLARNPVAELADAISRCHDARTGYVLIPGFYNAVRKGTREEIDRLLESGFNQEGFKKTLGLRCARKMSDREAIAALKLLPTFEVHGIVGGYTGPGHKTIIPHRAEAKISIRTVPDQSEQEVIDRVARYIKAINSDIEVIVDEVLGHFLTEISNDYVRDFHEVVERVTGRTCYFNRSGALIGALSVLKRNFNCPIIDFGLGLPEHGMHEKNEHFDWGQAETGMKILMEYFRVISGKK